ncbi:hypothetical protein CHS0354_031482, partial [Potamilus streckersoni]
MDVETSVLHTRLAAYDVKACIRLTPQQQAQFTEKKSSEKFHIPACFQILSEVGEATSHVLDVKMCQVLTKYSESIEYIHISDQYSGLKAQDYLETSHQVSGNQSSIIWKPVIRYLETSHQLSGNQSSCIWKPVINYLDTSHHVSGQTVINYLETSHQLSGNQSIRYLDKQLSIIWKSVIRYLETSHQLSGNQSSIIWKPVIMYMDKQFSTPYLFDYGITSIMVYTWDVGEAG